MREAQEYPAMQLLLWMQRISHPATTTLKERQANQHQMPLAKQGRHICLTLIGGPRLWTENFNQIHFFQVTGDLFSIHSQPSCCRLLLLSLSRFHGPQPLYNYTERQAPQCTQAHLHPHLLLLLSCVPFKTESQYSSLETPFAMNLAYAFPVANVLENQIAVSIIYSFSFPRP